MTWKNIIENILYITIFFIGIIVYDKFTRNPILIEAIKTETTKIETNIDSKIDNKFKRIDELHSKLDNAFPVTPTQILLPQNKVSENIQSVKINDSTECVTPQGYVLLKIENLTRRQKKRLGLK